MKERLAAALQSMEKGDKDAVVSAAEQIKRLPRTAEGLFDTVSVDEDCFEAARWIYPVYAYYETEYNKKENYPDLLKQMEALDAKQKEAASMEETARYLDALIHTIDNVTPQLYEYYIELADLFKAAVKEVISRYYKDGRFTDGSADEAEAEKLIRSAIAHAGETYVLLAEKYEAYM
ncbi:MAG: hypothetical protein NC420_15205 [Eubacterium sp.]|nr:hypothetical protein [Eubacterium sp.]MCM1214283.1 hypothetical protein [Lachnospiraceae bacterium]MCM1302566.1 hypothetical protein [Butyrivibrio sp.]MCM1342305.1 hypothetical protein [Muribaculaceae bacterium]MCM1238058.1 hypothetical protein [Lachnospiraceae bacterium]